MLEEELTPNKFKTPPSTATTTETGDNRQQPTRSTSPDLLSDRMNLPHLEVTSRALGELVSLKEFPRESAEESSRDNNSEVEALVMENVQREVVEVKRDEVDGVEREVDGVEREVDGVEREGIVNANSSVDEEVSIIIIIIKLIILPFI
jgi:hypothetical protein